MRELDHVLVAAEGRVVDLLHYPAELVQRVGVDVAAAHPAQEVRHLLGERDLLSLHEEDAFVLERTRPVHVHLELAANVLGDDQKLRKT